MDLLQLDEGMEVKLSIYSHKSVYVSKFKWFLLSLWSFGPFCCLEFSFWPRYNFVEPLTYQYVLGNLSLSRWHVDPSNWIYIFRVPSFIFHVPSTSCYWEKKGKVRSSVAIFDAAIINTKEYSSCRCFLRRINLINCPTWVRPALTISDHKGIFYTVFNLNTQVAEKCET